jgi:hypothetical protein
MCAAAGTAQNAFFCGTADRLADVSARECSTAARRARCVSDKHEHTHARARQRADGWAQVTSTPVASSGGKLPLMKQKPLPAEMPAPVSAAPAVTAMPPPEHPAVFISSSPHLAASLEPARAKLTNSTPLMPTAIAPMTPPNPERGRTPAIKSPDATPDDGFPPLASGSVELPPDCEQEAALALRVRTSCSGPVTSSSTVSSSSLRGRVSAVASDSDSNNEDVQHLSLVLPSPSRAHTGMSSDRIGSVERTLRRQHSHARICSARTLHYDYEDCALIIAQPRAHVPLSAGACACRNCVQHMTALMQTPGRAHLHKHTTRTYTRVRALVLALPPAP